MDLRILFLVCMLAGWLNRQQQAVIEYQQEGIAVLLEQLGGKPAPFTDRQRMRLAEKASGIL
ncbi:hypothetical protein N8642_04710 [bacterium]|jgi:hypothetical protein|nr:hypothetical protein [bacterium]